MERSVFVIRSLAERARADGFVPRAYATSAVREAVNGREFAAAVERECKVPVDIISGEDEARYAFLGASRGDEEAAMLDLGGASMQLVTKDFGVSFRAGCVRCGDIAREMTGAKNCDDCWKKQRDAVWEYMDGAVRLPELGEKRLIGVGGTITTLAALRTGLDRFDPEAVEGIVLTPENVRDLTESLAAMGEARREHPLLRERHDVILYGAYVLAYALRALGAKKLGISCADGLEGYLMKLKYERNE